MHLTLCHRTEVDTLDDKKGNRLRMFVILHPKNFGYSVINSYFILAWTLVKEPVGYYASDLAPSPLK